MAEDKNTPSRNIKFQMMMSKAESDAIDDWRFANRVTSKASAIRHLIAKGLEAVENGKA